MTTRLRVTAALAAIGKVSDTGVFPPRGNVIPLVGGSGVSVLTRTLNYSLVIWPALLFGILISAAALFLLIVGAGA